MEKRNQPDCSQSYSAIKAAAAVAIRPVATATAPRRRHVVQRTRCVDYPNQAAGPHRPAGWPARFLATTVVAVVAMSRHQFALRPGSVIRADLDCRRIPATPAILAELADMWDATSIALIRVLAAAR